MKQTNNINELIGVSEEKIFDTNTKKKTVKKIIHVKTVEDYQKKELAFMYNGRIIKGSELRVAYGSIVNPYNKRTYKFVSFLNLTNDAVITVFNHCNVDYYTLSSSKTMRDYHIDNTTALLDKFKDSIKSIRLGKSFNAFADFVINSVKTTKDKTEVKRYKDITESEYFRDKNIKDSILSMFSTLNYDKVLSTKKSDNNKLNKVAC